MIPFGKLKPMCAALALGMIFHSPSVFACAMCYGKSDSPLAQGMNWGIFSLLGVIVTVLGGIATFFIYLARKSARTLPSVPEAALPEPTQNI